MILETERLYLREMNQSDFDSLKGMPSKQQRRVKRMLLKY